MTKCIKCGTADKAYFLFGGICGRCVNEATAKNEAARIAELEAQGLTTSDAQAVIMAEYAKQIKKVFG